MTNLFFNGSTAWCCAVAWVLSIAGEAMAAEAEKGMKFDREKPAVRSPIGLAWRKDQGRLLVANRDTGSVSVVDPQRRQVVDEFHVGGRLVDFRGVPGRPWLAAVDEVGQEIVLMSFDGSLHVHQRLKVGPSPVQVYLTEDGRRAFAALLWTRQVVEVALPDLTRSGELQPAEIVQVYDLPFSPRCMLAVKEGKVLLVADSFAGGVAVVDLEQRKIRAVRETPGHNIRGLSLANQGKTLVVSQQIISSLAETTHNDIHWGVLMTNLLRWVELERVLDPKADLLEGSRVQLLGEAGNAGGDPGQVRVSAEGQAVVLLTGVAEIAYGEEDAYTFRRQPVGDGPCAMAFDDDGWVYVANRFSDSISTFRLDGKIPPSPIPLGNRAEPSEAQQGEALFYDARLSMEGWFSCHSCHTDGHSNGQKNDNLSDGGFGSPKRVLSLLGVHRTGPWAWDGKTKSLEDQIQRSIKSTMQGPELRPTDMTALIAYLKTLEPPKSRESLLGKVDASAVARGAKIFTARNCAECHAGPDFTTPETHNVGLADEQGLNHFNPPSLLGVDHRPRLLHDSRASSLPSLFTRQRHPSGEPMTAEDARDLAAYLKSL